MITRRTKFTKNEIIIDGNIASIRLYKDNKEIKEKAIIDTDSATMVMNHKWSLTSRGYVINWTKRLFLHHLVIGRNVNMVVDHINRNKLDNRRSNLRHVPQRINCLNCKISKNSKSGINGVYFRKDIKKWCAQIKIKYKSINIGCFNNLEDAKKARLHAEDKYLKINL